MKAASYKLKPDERDRLYEAFEQCRAAEAMLASVIAKCIESTTRDRVNAWDSAARMLGFASQANAYEQGYLLRVDWIASELIAETKGDQE